MSENSEEVADKASSFLEKLAGFNCFSGSEDDNESSEKKIDKVRKPSAFLLVSASKLSVTLAD